MNAECTSRSIARAGRLRGLARLGRSPTRSRPARLRSSPSDAVTLRLQGARRGPDRDSQSITNPGAGTFAAPAGSSRGSHAARRPASSPAVIPLGSPGSPSGSYPAGRPDEELPSTKIYGRSRRFRPILGQRNSIDRTMRSDGPFDADPAAAPDRCGGSAWESNPPAACFQTAHRF